MKRYVLPYLFALVGILLPVLPAQAGPPIYAGNLQVVNGANLSFLSGGTGCLLVQNGVAYIAACPIGTVAFSAASPFTVTGSGPYVIGCPTCFTSSGGTITGATTFSNTLTLNGAVSSINTLTTTSTITAGKYNIADSFHMPSGCITGITIVTPSSNVSNNVGGVTPTALGAYCGSAIMAVDTNGNLGVLGQMFATQYNVVSKRAYKYDIQPLSFDALQVLHDADFKAFRYKKGHGDPRLPHIGIIADDSPSVLSGEKHDHLDIEALATVDAAAILQLNTQIQVLYIILAALALLLVCAVAVLGLVWHDNAAG